MAIAFDGLGWDVMFGLTQCKHRRRCKKYLCCRCVNIWLSFFLTSRLAQEHDVEALPPGASERISSTSCTWLEIRGMCAEPQDIRKSISKKLLTTTVIPMLLDRYWLIGLQEPRSQGMFRRFQVQRSSTLLDFCFHYPVDLKFQKVRSSSSTRHSTGICLIKDIRLKFRPCFSGSPSTCGHDGSKRNGKKMPWMVHCRSGNLVWFTCRNNVVWFARSSKLNLKGCR